MFRWINDTYLGHLFHEDRKLFFWIAGFFLVTIFCNFLKLEATPFFLWGMYSEREERPSSYSILQLSVNDTNIIDYSVGFSDNTRFFLSSPISYYKRMRENGDEDPTLSFIRQRSPSIANMIAHRFPSVLNDSASLQHFGGWYRRYLQSCTGLTINTIDLKEILAHYGSAGNIIADSTYPFEAWHY